MTPPCLPMTPDFCPNSRLSLIPFFTGLLLLTACASKPPLLDLPNNAAPTAAFGKPSSRTAPSPLTNAAASTSIAPLQAIPAGQVGSLKVMSAEPPKELWERIRLGYAMPDLQDPLVTDREQWYATRPDYILRMTERSSKYLFHVVEELERRQMPTELALLPFIESAFNPQAVSSAKAAGMWQFMPATGKYFDLKQNAFRDDRRDVLASTRAALDYLQKLYGMFGDWHLALAAYNWGEGSVGRAIARNKKAGLGTSYQELSMPAETRLYVPKLQAVKNIVANPQSFRAELPVIGNHPYFQQVQLTRDIDVVVAARLADVKLEDFKALNPAAHRPIIIASGTPQILLPWDNALVFQRNFAAFTQGQLASWTAWTAPATLSVSDAARRVGMAEAELRSVNNIPPRMLIKAGSTLLVSRSSTVQNDVAVSVVDNAQMSLAPEVTTKRYLVKAKKADTLTSLAKRYGVDPLSVAQWNGIKASVLLKAGQQIVVFMPIRTEVRSVMGSGKPGIHPISRKVAGKAVGKGVIKSTGKTSVKPIIKTQRR